MTGSFNLGAMLGTPVNAETQVKQIPCNMCVPYHNHQFQLYSGERCDDMVASIKENGVLIPDIMQSINTALINQTKDRLSDGKLSDEKRKEIQDALDYYEKNIGKYEILIGHNRWNCSILAGKDTIPTILKEELSYEEAEMYVIESNLMQRGFDNLKISEQAAVIALRYEKMFSQGKRNDIIKELKLIENPQLQAEEDDETEKPKNSREKVGAEYGLSRNSVARLLRVNKLILGLKNLVDDGNIPIRAAVDLSYLSEEEQNMVVNPARKFKVDMKKAELLRDFSQTHGLNLMTAVRILNGSYLEEQKLPKPKTIRLNNETYSKFFKEDVKPDEVTQTIEKALEMYFSSL